MNFEALFLGPKSENREWLKKIVVEMIEEHIHWRRDFHPTDVSSITRKDQSQSDFLQTQQLVEDNLFKLSNILRSQSPPFHSPRYAAHMCSDTLLPAVLAYITTMLYNPNNVAWEASPVTTDLEVQSGQEMAKLLGFDPVKSYGHITSGGTLANIEALWLARNMKTIPYGLKKVAPDLIGEVTNHELDNFSLEKTLALVDKVGVDKVELLKEHSIRGQGLRGGSWGIGKIFAPRTKHYSWNKATDVLGIGENNLVLVDVDTNFRLSIPDLKKKVFDSIHKGECILMVVGVVGTTEEGAVDPLHEIVNLREECIAKHGVWFWIHVDAAYGGYSASIFHDENFNLIPHKDLIRRLHDDKIINEKFHWPSLDVYNAYASIKKFNSVTIDPHKLGYIPYQAGGIVVGDQRVRHLVSFFATYIFEVAGDTTSVPLGSYILEGSKAGATAAAVYTAHKCVPGNISGYGKIIGESFEGAQLFYEKLQLNPHLSIEASNKTTRHFSFITLNYPDTNIMVYVINEDGNKSITKLNTITGKIRDLTSPKNERQTCTFDIFFSSTSLTKHEYGDCVKPILSNIGLDVSDWDKIGTFTVLRSTFMSPYCTPDFTEANYPDKVISGTRRILKFLVDRNDI